MLQKLRKAGADPNLRSSNYGWTPLMLATVLSYTNTVGALISYLAAPWPAPDAAGAASRLIG